MVEQELPKLKTGVQFSSPAPPFFSFYLVFATRIQRQKSVLSSCAKNIEFLIAFLYVEGYYFFPNIAIKRIENGGTEWRYDGRKTRLDHGRC
jgi:hypothetical protein